MRVAELTVPGLTLTPLKYCCINHGDQRVFQFEIIIYAIAFPGSFKYMLWVYGHHKYFNYFSTGTVLIRRILM